MTTTYASDTFDRANGAIGTSDGPGSLVWTVHTGAWSIFSNFAFSTSTNNTHAYTTLTVGQSDVTVSADVTLSATSNRCVIGFLVRYTDGNNHVRVYMAKEPNFGDGNVIVVEQHLAGATTYPSVLNSAGLVENTTYTFKAIVSGSTVGVWVDGVERIAPVSFDAGLSTQNYGLWTIKGSSTNDSGNSYWNNFLVTDNASVGAAPRSTISSQAVQRASLR